MIIFRIRILICEEEKAFSVMKEIYCISYTEYKLSILNDKTGSFELILSI